MDTYGPSATVAQEADMQADDKLRRRVARIEAVLVREGVTHREQLLPPHYDARTKFENFAGIGKVLGKALRNVLDHADDEVWYQLFQSIRWDSNQGD